MRTRINKKAIVGTAGILLLSTALFAQPGPGRGHCGGGHGRGYGNQLSEEERMERLEDRVDYMAYKLELSDDQKAKILEIKKKHQEERAKEREEMQRRREEAYKKHQAEIKAVLTDEQKVKYEEGFCRRNGQGQGYGRGRK